MFLLLDNNFHALNHFYYTLQDAYPTHLMVTISSIWFSKQLMFFGHLICMYESTNYSSRYFIETTNQPIVCFLFIYMFIIIVYYFIDTLYILLIY